MNQHVKSSGQPKTKGRKKRYEKDDIHAVLGARQNLKISGVAIGDQTAKDLAVNALTTKSEMHMIACVAELLARLEGHSVRDMLNRLPQVEKDERRIHGIQNGSNSNHKRDD